MLRTALLSLIIFVSLSSSTLMIRKSISRRQTDPQYCHAIEGFECKCSYYRVTCTNDRDLPSPINILQNEKQKYQSVELVITAPRDINVNDHTFEPVKELYKPDGDNLEFRVKFEKFTALNLGSPGIFNRVFPDNLPPNARKHLALEVYNPDVPPSDNPNLFQNLNADSLELYALYPFHGTFQQLFNGANIKYLRLSGGDIRSDVSQPFTGTIGRLELAKQANALSVQNFPVYPAHELVINAFYITEFNSEHPPNYANLGELRVYSPERIPANAFRQFPNIHTLSISTDKDIDPQALNGLNNLEKLTIKDTKVSLDLLNKIPNIKEFETNIEKLDEKTQCQLLEKLAKGQVAVQNVPNGRECNCVTAYLDTAAGRTPCDAQHCEHSSCAVIKNNYDASARTFKAPPPIRRSDGTDALRQRESRVYTAPFQVTSQDQEKLQKGIPPPVQPQPEDDSRRPGDGEPWQPYPPQDTFREWSVSDVNDYADPHDEGELDSYDYLPVIENNQPEKSEMDYTNEYNNPSNSWDYPNHYDSRDDLQYDRESEIDISTIPYPFFDGRDGDSTTTNEGGENRPEGEGGENQPEGEGSQPGSYDPNTGIEGSAGNGTETGTPPKKTMSWLPIIIIAASIVGLLLVGLIVLLVRKRRTSSKGYVSTATTEQGTAGTTARA